MEPNPQTPQSMAPGSAPAPMVGQTVLSSAAAKSTEEQRAKWREKYERRKARKLGVPFVPASADAPAAPPAIDAPAEKLPGAVVVPWNPNTLLPLVSQIVDQCERSDVDGLKKKAEKISPALVADVEKDAPWNSVSKSTLATSGSAIGAKWLAKMGVREENAPEVTFCIALGAILTGRNVLVEKLDKLIAQGAKELEEKKA